MTRPAPSARPDVHEDITTAILADLQRGVRPWTRAWTKTGAVQRPRRHDGQAYHGINVLLLWASAADQGFERPTWMTFRQALALGGCVRRGETGTRIVFAGRREGPASQTDEAQTSDDDRPADDARGAVFLKRYSVFNLEQIDGLDLRYPAQQPLEGLVRDARAERFFAAVGADIRHGGDIACYLPREDRVHMPHLARFKTVEAYYAVLAHELTHWTGHASRLDRLGRFVRFGDSAYAREELVAELGAAFLCADLGLSLEPRPDHAAYLASWLKVLKDDNRFIVTAAAQAERAVALLGARAEALPAPG
jgi:antirestriction protein ArdC